MDSRIDSDGATDAQGAGPSCCGTTKKTAVMAVLRISVGSTMVTVLPELDSIFK